MQILRKIREFVDEKRIIKNGDRVVISVSGGPDSVFLLHLFLYLKKFYNISLAVVYIHHHLRKEADKELIFVKELSQMYCLPFYYRNIRIEEKTGIEEKARTKRYRALYSITKRIGFNKIAVGHTLDDQVETVVMRFIKGTGMTGLRGILPETFLFDDTSISVIRPLLCVEKKDVLGFLEGKKIDYLLDRSNLSTDFFRNRIRLEVIPFLLRYNPQLKKQVAQMSFLLQDDFSFLLETGQNILEKLVSEKGRVFNISGYKVLDISLKRIVAALLIEKITGSPYRSYNKIKQLVDYLNRYPGKRIKIEKIGKVVRGR